MKIVKSFVVLIAVVMGSSSAFGWGQKGHDVVASIAEEHLKPCTKRHLKKILGGESLVYYASWMDNVQNSPYWKFGYNRTKTWHYANVDKGETYQSMPKNTKGDVVTALDSLTTRFRTEYKTLTDSMKTDYIKMIVHLVGDLHCPMHAGRLSDLGGNKLGVKWFGQKTNLHSVWDGKLIESAHKWSYSEWTEQLDRKDRKFRKSVCRGTFEDWLCETVDCATQIYGYVEAMPENPNLSYQFVYDFTPMLEQQLLLAGYRLAYVLNSLF